MTVPAAATRLTPGFRHGRRKRLGGGLDGICHLGRAASLPKAAGERQKHIQGVSTRNVKAITEEPCGHATLSARKVSRQFLGPQTNL
jgi:hypothetical protein